MIELRLWQGLDTAETATVMGISTAHANSLLYRARNQLTAAVGVLLVARAGPGDCARLKGILSGWDGHLTPLLRKRLSRHIGHCRTCSDLRNQVLRPTLLTLWPAGTLAAAVAGEQAQHAAAVPAGLKDQVLRAAAVSRDADGARASERHGCGRRPRPVRKERLPQPAVASAHRHHDDRGRRRGGAADARARRPGASDDDLSQPEWRRAIRNFPGRAGRGGGLSRQRPRPGRARRERPRACHHRGPGSGVVPG